MGLFGTQLRPYSQPKLMVFNYIHMVKTFSSAAPKRKSTNTAQGSLVGIPVT